MADKFTLKEFERSTAKFTDYGQRLIAAELLSFGATLRQFVAFCEGDRVISAVTGQLKETTKIDVEGWFKRLQTNLGMVVRMDIPEDEEARLAIFYRFLLKLSAERAPETFIRVNFRAHSIRESLLRFHSVVTENFIKDLGYKLDEIHDTIQRDAPDGTFGVNLLRIFDQRPIQIAASGGVISNAPVGSIQAASGSNISQVVQTGKADLDEVIRKAWEAIITEQSLSEDEREHYELDLAQLTQELKLAKPRPDTVFERIKNLAACTALVHHAGAILTSLIEKYGWAVPPMLEFLKR